MHLIAWRTLREYIETLDGHTDQAKVRKALREWRSSVEKAAWTSPADVKAAFGSASILKSGRAVFNICGNSYRLVVKINYGNGVVFVRFIGTHAAYDEIDAEEV